MCDRELNIAQLNPKGRPVLKTLPLIVAVILIATALPTGLRSSGPSGISLGVSPGDFLMNMVLYLPLGAALARQGVVQAGVVASFLSFGIEMVQLFSQYRYASPLDVMANAGGASIGAAVAGKWNMQCEMIELRGITRPIILACLLLWLSAFRPIMRESGTFLPSVAAFSGLIVSCTLFSIATPEGRSIRWILAATFGLLGGAITLSVVPGWQNEVWVLGLSLAGGVACAFARDQDRTGGESK